MIASAWVALVLAAPAAQVAPRPVDVETAVAQALAQNPGIRAAEMTLRAAEARLAGAGAWPNPNLSLVVDQVPVTNPGAGNYMAGVGQPLMPGGLREARFDAATVDVALAAIARDLARRALATEVKAAYARHQFDHEEVRTATLGQEAADAAWRAAMARYRAGELARIDVLRAEVERGRARRDFAAAESHERQSLAELNMLLGRESEAAIEVEVPTYRALPGLPTLAVLLARATARRPELQQAELVIRREVAQRQLTVAAVWTGTEATVAGGLVAGQPGFSTTLTMPIPLIRRPAEIAEAEANRARAEAERDALRHRLRLEVEQAFHEASIAARQATLHQTDLVPQAARLADNAGRRYAAGEGSGLEVAEARRALRQAHSDHHRALLEFRQAMVRLEHATAGPLWEGGRDGRP